MSASRFPAGIDTVSGDVAIGGNATVAGTHGVTGAVSLASTLAVTGAVTLSSTLAVTGASTLTGLLTANGGITLGAAQTITIPADGVIAMAAGAQIQAVDTQAANVSAVPTAGSADAAANATAINSIITALEGVGILASS